MTTVNAATTTCHGIKHKTARLAQDFFKPGRNSRQCPLNAAPRVPEPRAQAAISSPAQRVPRKFAVQKLCHFLHPKDQNGVCVRDPRHPKFKPFVCVCVFNHLYVGLNGLSKKRIVLYHFKGEHDYSLESRRAYSWAIPYEKSTTSAPLSC